VCAYLDMIEDYVLDLDGDFLLTCLSIVFI